MPLRPLIFDIGLHSLERGATGSCHKIASGPELLFPELFPDIREFGFEPPGLHGFNRINKFTDIFALAAKSKCI